MVRVYVVSGMIVFALLTSVQYFIAYLNGSLLEIAPNVKIVPFLIYMAFVNSIGGAVYGFIYGKFFVKYQIKGPIVSSIIWFSVVNLVVVFLLHGPKFMGGLSNIVSLIFTYCLAGFCFAKLAQYFSKD